MICYMFYNWIEDSLILEVSLVFAWHKKTINRPKTSKYRILRVFQSYDTLNLPMLQILTPIQSP